MLILKIYVAVTSECAFILYMLNTAAIVIWFDRFLFVNKTCLDLAK